MNDDTFLIAYKLGVPDNSRKKFSLIFSLYRIFSRSPEVSAYSGETVDITRFLLDVCERLWTPMTLRSLIQIRVAPPPKNPVVSTTTGFSFRFFHVVFPYFFPLQNEKPVLRIGNPADKRIHAACAVLAHLLGYMPIHIQRESGSGMA